MTFSGLRTVIYPAPDLAAAKAWFTQVLGIEPYFDQPFYVGFEVDGYEVGLDPDGDVALGARTYLGVDSVPMVLAAGATVVEPVFEPGDGITLASVRLPWGGGVLGIIDNPHFGAGSA